MTARSLKPLGSRLVVRRNESAGESPGGIILPEKSRETQTLGIVERVGPGYRMEGGGEIPLSVSVGDEVVFSTYAGNEVDIDGEILLILDEHETVAVVEPVA